MKTSKGPAGLPVTFLFVGALAVASLLSGLTHGGMTMASILGGNLFGSHSTAKGGGW